MDDAILKNKGPGCANSTGPKSDTQPDKNTKDNTSSTADFQANQDETESIFKRPGVTDKTLVEAGVRRVTPDGAENLCGLAAPGIWIPYFDTDGKPIIFNGRPYGRLRLDKPWEVSHEK